MCWTDRCTVVCIPQWSGAAARWLRKLLERCEAFSRNQPIEQTTRQRAGDLETIVTHS